MTDRYKAMRLANLLKEHVFAIKVGWPLIMSAGISIVDQLSLVSKVICDLKLADIPNTNALIVRQLREHRAYGV